MLYSNLLSWGGHGGVADTAAHYDCHTGGALRTRGHAGTLFMGQTYALLLGH